MANILLRATKGSPLTNTEGDNNLTALNNAKIEVGGDLGGNTTSPEVVGIRTYSVSASAPANNSVLTFNSTSNTIVWVVPSTDISASYTTNTVIIEPATGASATVTAANTTAAGVMTVADKAKLDGIEASADVNVPTNLSTSYSTTVVTVESSTGDNTTILTANSTSAGILTRDDKVKLDTIAEGAQVNVPTNLTTTANTATRTILSSTGDDVIIPGANTTAAGVMTSADKTILNNLGTASTVDTGLASNQIPLNSNLGTAAYVNTGAGSTQVPTNSILGPHAYVNVTITTSTSPTGGSNGDLWYVV